MDYSSLCQNALSGGLNYTILMVISMLIGIVMWYPFIKIADKKNMNLKWQQNN